MILRSLCLFILALLSTHATAAAACTDPQPVLASVVVLDANSVAYMRTDGSLAIASIADLVAGTSGSTIVLDVDSAAPKHTFETTYQSANGTHTVTTPCGSTPLDSCAAQHRDAVVALQRVFPRVAN